MNFDWVVMNDATTFVRYRYAIALRKEVHGYVTDKSVVDTWRHWCQSWKSPLQLPHHESELLAAKVPLNVISDEAYEFYRQYKLGVPPPRSDKTRHAARDFIAYELETKRWPIPLQNPPNGLLVDDDVERHVFEAMSLVGMFERILSRYSMNTAMWLIAAEAHKYASGSSYQRTLDGLDLDIIGWDAAGVNDATGFSYTPGRDPWRWSTEVAMVEAQINLLRYKRLLNRVRVFNYEGWREYSDTPETPYPWENRVKGPKP
jgi:hypothetical protein